MADGWKSYADHSRQQWGVTYNGYPGHEPVMIGCLQRVADATEELVRGLKEVRELLREVVDPVFAATRTAEREKDRRFADEYRRVSDAWKRADEALDFDRLSWPPLPSAAKSDLKDAIRWAARYAVYPRGVRPLPDPETVEARLKGLDVVRVIHGMTPPRAGTKKAERFAALLAANPHTDGGD